MTMDEKYENADDLSTEILIYLANKKIDPNTGQAALGSAWFRLCHGMQIDTTDFKEMCDGMVNLYPQHGGKIPNG